MRTGLFADKPTPAPLQRQAYYPRLKELAQKATEYYGDRKPQAQDIPARAKKKPGVPPTEEPPSEKSAHSKEGMDIKWIRNVDVPERFFNKDSYDEWRAIVEDENDFLSVIPKGDPYRMERLLNVYASGDFRYFGMKSDKDILEEKDQRTWLMGSDIGVRLRPTSYHQLSAVVEARFLNAPSNEDPEDGFAASDDDGSGAMAKSAYLLVDNLAYNSFLQAGLYRPMFGLHNPDHESLSSRISGLTQAATYKAYGFGTAPNVPFLVANYIQPRTATGTEFEASDGFAVTAGARFVTYGASASASYWDTKWTTVGSTITQKRNMYAFTGGANFKIFNRDLIVNYEFLRAERSDSSGTKNAGTVNTVQTKFRVWREIYTVLNYAYANVARSLGEGDTEETMVGLRSFLMSNFELETLYILRDFTEANVDTGYDLIQLQAHVFF
jgi:hypothetical protein